jgi:hypothetical protein
MAGWFVERLDRGHYTLIAFSCHPAIFARSAANGEIEHGP